MRSSDPAQPRSLNRRTLFAGASTLGAAVAADGARIVNKAAVESGAEFSGFIVKFRDGTAQRHQAEQERAAIDQRRCDHFSRRRRRKSRRQARCRHRDRC